MNYKLLFLLIILSFSCDFENENLDSLKETNNKTKLQQDTTVINEIKNHTDISWKKAGIAWCYKLDEQSSFTKGFDNEKKWLDEKIKKLLSTDLTSLIDSNQRVKWNSANDL